MPKIELNKEQVAELQNLLAKEIGLLEWLIGVTRHPDDIEDRHRKSVLSDILHLLEIA